MKKIVEKEKGNLSRAISLLQPWAWLLAAGIKRFETRSWPTSYRGVTYIHASKGFGKQQERLFLSDKFQRYTNMYNITPADLVRGAIIGKATLVNVYTAEEFKSRFDAETIAREGILGDITDGRYVWEYSGHQLFPIHEPVKGNLGIWYYDNIQLERKLHLATITQLLSETL
jgi:hypothetical protein